MKTVVVGGHSRNIGKTSVMAGLIRGLDSQRWTAVKITQYGHGICSEDGQPCDCEPTEHPFVLTAERDATGRSDTSRFLKAGASRSLWLRARQGQLAEALPILERALAEEERVIIESNSIMEFLEPSVFLVVLAPEATDFKPSALEFLGRADALVPVNSRGSFDAGAWPAINPRSLENKPAFPVAAGAYISSELCEFVRKKLLTAPEIDPGESNSLFTRRKETTCQH